MCVCHGHKIQPISFIELEIEFCLKTNLDFFFAQIPQRPTSGASLGISRMESLICRNSSQLELNRRIVNSGTASGKVGARTLQQNFFGKIELNRESRSVAHPPPLLLPSQSVILSSEENFKGRYVTSLVTRRGWWCKALVTGGWWARSTQLARWVAVYWQAHPPSSDGHRPTARRSSPRTRRTCLPRPLLLKYASY